MEPLEGASETQNVHSIIFGTYRNRSESIEKDRNRVQRNYQRTLLKAKVRTVFTPATVTTYRDIH